MRVDGYVGPQGAGPLDPKADALLRSAQAEPTVKPTEASGESRAADSEATGDTLEMSAQAQALLAGAKDTGEKKTEGAARPEAVARARQILQAGLYNDRGVLEQTAARIAENFAADA